MIDYSELLSERAKQLSDSSIKRFFSILEEMEDAISLGIGEPDYVTPLPIREAGIRALREGHTKYTDNNGMTVLRQEIAKYLARRFGLRYDWANQILVTVGGSEAIDLTLRALVGPGDEVIIPVPSFVCYGPITTLTGGVPVYVETGVEERFRLSPERLRAAITPRTKLLVLPFPNNPTGAVMEREDLEQIAGVLADTDIMVLSDEIYAELTYGRRHVSFASLPGMAERTVVVNGFSKSHAMTGWRLGYLCGPEPIVKAISRIHQYGIMSAPTVSQYAAIEAMSGCDEAVEEMTGDYHRRRDLVLEGLRRVGLDCYTPGGAFYAFPSITSTGLSSAAFCERLLMEEKVAVIPGSAFGPGGEGFVRICYASSEENLKEALYRMERFVKMRKLI